MKAGENMTGKFNNANNRVASVICIISTLVAMIGGAVVFVKVEPLLGVIILVLIPAAIILPPYLLKECEFSADHEKIVIREAFLKRTYYFSEIRSASSQVGFSHGRYGASARVELVITLSDGKCVTFYDEDVPDDALSNPKNHKKFQDAHQFTALCQYINERASG